MDERRFADATTRNREPVREVLARHVRPGTRVLEIASGTGEHAVFLAEALGVASWQPSDPDAASRRSIDAWRASSARVLPALDLDVERDPWPAIAADAMVCINMIHISPWSACLALMRRASVVLPAGGILYLYGPYRQDGVPTAPSNEGFDASLRARNPLWGLRRLEDVVAAAAGFSPIEVVSMPANNLSVVLGRD